MPRALVDGELVDRFREDGFVVVPDRLTDDEVERYGAAVRRRSRR